MAIRHFAVRLHAQVAAETARHPRRVTCVASHAALAVGKHLVLCGRIAPRRIVLLHRLGVGRFFVVIGVAGRNGVDRLLHFPATAEFDGRVLDNISFLQDDRLAVDVLTLFRSRLVIGGQRLQHKQLFAVARSKREARQIAADQRLVRRLSLCKFILVGRLHRRFAARYPIRFRLYRTVAIDTADLDRGARLVVENARAVAVLLEMTIGAVHAFFEVDILQMHCLVEFSGIVRCNDLAIGVEQIALTVFLINVLKDPSVAVRIGKLHVFQLGVEIGRAGFLKKDRIGPKPA